jgi:tRNA modification GTPase
LRKKSTFLSLPIRLRESKPFVIALNLEVAKITAVFMYEEDTIAAIATPIGEGGVAIVRVSGPDAERIASRIFVRKGEKNGELKSHTLYYGTIQDPRTRKNLDDILLAVMRKPRSYTGEDVVEFHCHGGVFLVRQVLGLILAHGARYADPGEFTKRAFLNGRLDLTQAEAVQDLIRARTDKAVELALNQANGELSKWVNQLREELLDILVQIEAAIDFPEEEIELLQRDQLITKAGAIVKKTRDILDTYERGRLFRDGARVCICGRPNVGKSSLLNALLGQDRVIVTPLPGTTRDVIEESINIEGLPVVLWDTAGIRNTTDQVESIGVDLSLQHLEKADAVIVVLDGSLPLTDDDLFCLTAVESKKNLVVINKNDLGQRFDTNQIRKTATKQILSISATQGYGLRDLEIALRELLLGADREPPTVLTNIRHKNALLRGEEALGSAIASLIDRRPPECVAVDLNDARDAFEEVIGIVNNEDILERIFSKFCVGK